MMLMPRKSCKHKSPTSYSNTLQSSIFGFSTSVTNSLNSNRNFNLKFYFEYVLFNIPHLYVFFKLQFLKTNTLLVSQIYSYFLILHLRFSSLFYTTQLVDMFAYELPVSGSSQEDSQQAFRALSNTTVVYNFHNIRNHDRFFIFSPAPSSSFLAFPLHSISELYPNSN